MAMSLTEKRAVLDDLANQLREIRGENAPPDPSVPIGPDAPGVQPPEGLDSTEREKFLSVLNADARMGVDTSPLPVPSRLTMQRGHRGPVAPTSQNRSATRTALEAGVLTDEPAPFRALAESSFGLKKQDQLFAIKRGIELYRGHPTEVRMGPETNQLEYIHMDPETGEKRWAVVNELGGGMSDVAELTGPALVGLFETAGTVGAYLAGMKSTSALDNAGAMSAGVGEIIRLMIGKQLGLNDELQNPEDFILEGMKTSGLSKLSATGVRTLLTAAKFIQNLFGGKVIPPAVARRIKEKFEIDSATLHESIDVQDQINSVLKQNGDNPSFEYTLAQKTGDAELLDMQSNLAHDAFIGPQLRKVRRAQQEAAEKFFDIAAAKEGIANEVPDQLDLGLSIRRLITEGMTSERRVANQLVNQTREAERLAVENISPTVKPSDITGKGVIPWVNDSEVLEPFQSKYAGHPLRKVLEKEFSEMAYGLSNAFNGFKQVSGVQEIPLTETRKAVGKLGKQVDTVLFPFTAKGRRALVTGFDPEATAASPEVVADQLKFINDKLRVAKTDPTLDRGALLELKGALERDANAQYGKTPADAEMWRELKEQYGKFQDIYRRSAIDDILARSEGRNFDMANEKVFKEFFKPDNDTFAATLREALDGRPDAQQLVRRGIFAEYRDRVAPEGVIDIKAHQKFVKDYGGTIKPFFSEAEYKEIVNQPRGIVNAIQKAEEESKVLVDAINAKLDTRFEKKTPGEMFHLLWDGDNVTAENLRSVLPIVKQDPELLTGIKTLAHDHIRQQVTTRKNGVDFVDGDKLDAYIGNFAYKDRIKTLFGDKYLKNLETLSKAMAIAKREGEYIPEPKGTALMDIARVHVGMFTAAGRLLTASVRTQGKAANAMIMRVLLSEVDAESFAKMASVRPATERAASLAATLGAPDLYIGYGVTRQPKEKEVTDFNSLPWSPQVSKPTFPIGRP